MKLWGRRDRGRPPPWTRHLRYLPAFVSLNRDLIPAVAANAAGVPELKAFRGPVRIVFGAREAAADGRVDNRANAGASG
jgi:hypothetical protein